jgi:hypothetical protein
MGKDITALVHVWHPREPYPKQHSNQQSLFETAMSDAALFHAILCSSSLYLDIASGNSESYYSIIHKTEAIHLVNTQLQDSSKVSDATIGTVDFLAVLEIYHCSDSIYILVKITFGPVRTRKS